MSKIGVRFKNLSKIYTYQSNLDLKRNDNVIVETPSGLSFGTVETVEKLHGKFDLDTKNIVRKATEEDKAKNEKNIEREKEAVKVTRELVLKLGLDINVVGAEYSFEGSKVIIDFLSENRVDFRELVKELAIRLKTRIELRQIGIRDQAKKVGGIGICGRVCCCVSHLNDFEKVSIKMAKVQGLALNPTKISGSCGRLMCCLEYENPYYNEVYPKIPRINSEVKTKDGIGTVVYTNALKQIVSVKIGGNDGSFLIKDFSLDEIVKIENFQSRGSTIKSENKNKENQNKTENKTENRKS